MKEATSKIQEQGNTTIPQSVRDYLELDRGASIVYTFDPNGKVEIQKQIGHKPGAHNVRFQIPTNIAT